MMEINSQQILLVIFRLFCFLTTMGLCAFWVYRFSLNEDYSIITYRKFIEKESDTYPTISFCLRDPFLKNRLAEYGTNVSSYLKFLKGDYLTEDMLSIDYKNVTIDIADYVKGYRLYFRNGSITKLDSGLNREEKESLTYISYSGFSGYSNHFSKCFALNIPSIHDLYIFRTLKTICNSCHCLIFPVAMCMIITLVSSVFSSFPSDRTYSQIQLLLILIDTRTLYPSFVPEVVPSSQSGINLENSRGSYL